MKTLSKLFGVTSALPNQQLDCKVSIFVRDSESHRSLIILSQVEISSPDIPSPLIEQG